MCWTKGLGNQAVAKASDEPVPVEQPREPSPRREAVDQAPRRSDRTAVLIVHGIGSQRPLDTLRGVVAATWSTDRAVAGPEPKNWITFKSTADDVDLPVVTTGNVSDPSGPPHNSNRQIEFHEFYWAHVMAETRLFAVLVWLFEFVRKGPAGLLPALQRLWWAAAPFLILVIYSAVLLCLDAAFALLGLPGDDPIGWPTGVTAAIVAAVMFWRGVLILIAISAAFTAAAYLFRGEGSLKQSLIGQLNDPPSMYVAIGVLIAFAAAATFFLTSVLGDAARYYRNSPSNIRVRREIRKIGADLLAQLHQGRHDRIIVVAHSLGSVIAYDILRAYWAAACRKFGNVADIPEVAIQDDFLRDKATDPIGKDTFAVSAMTPGERKKWRSGGRQLVNILNARRPRGEKLPIWLVTDFVTIGSPLAHARYLNATGNSARARRDYFTQRLVDREVPQCPAVYSDKDGTLTFTPTGQDRANVRLLHNAALFGLTRWTNLFFPSRVFNGDFIGGPLQGVLGQGMKDVPLATKGRKLSWHTWYWRWTGGDAPPRYLEELRAALNLLDRDETAAPH